MTKNILLEMSGEIKLKREVDFTQATAIIEYFASYELNKLRVERDRIMNRKHTIEEVNSINKQISSL